MLGMHGHRKLTRPAHFITQCVSSPNVFYHLRREVSARNDNCRASVNMRDLHSLG